jgi:hypothetical protein
MPAANSGMGLNDELGSPVWLVREMPALAAGEAGDPIQLTDDGMCAEMEQIDIFTESEVSYSGVFLHDQTARKNPSQADTATWVDRKAKLLLEQRASHPPGEKDRQEHEKMFHQTDARDR